MLLYRGIRSGVHLKKIYAQPLDEALFLDASVPERNYRDHDLHTQYFGRIVKTLVREAVPPEEGR